MYRCAVTVMRVARAGTKKGLNKKKSIFYMRTLYTAVANISLPEARISLFPKSVEVLKYILHELNKFVHPCFNSLRTPDHVACLKLIVILSIIFNTNLPLFSMYLYTFRRYFLHTFFVKGFFKYRVNSNCLN